MATILQFGTGKFLRGYFDWMVHILNQQRLTQHKIALLQSTGHDRLDSLQENKGIYHIVLVGGSYKKSSEEIEKIDVFEQYLRGDNLVDLSSIAHDPELQLIISNTTEAGISLQQEDSPTNLCSFPAKLLWILHERYQAFAGDLMFLEKNLLVVPCELIEKNGDYLKQQLLTLVKKWNYSEEFSVWFQKKILFYNTLVDRIVSGYPKKEIKSFETRLQAKDPNLVKAEKYHFFAVQGNHKKFDKVLPFSKTDLNIIYTDDLNQYQEVKVKILNGLHTILVVIGSLSGKKSVGESIQDITLYSFLEKALQEEIIDQIPLPRREVEEYVHKTLLRFENPSIYHELKDIQLNSTAKIDARLFPTILSYYIKNNSFPPRLSRILVLYIDFFLFSGFLIREPEIVQDFYAELKEQYIKANLSEEKMIQQFFVKNPSWLSSHIAKKLFQIPSFFSRITILFKEYKQNGQMLFLEETLK